MNTGLKSVRYVGSVVSQSADSGLRSFAFSYSINIFINDFIKKYRFTASRIRFAAYGMYFYFIN